MYRRHYRNNNKSEKPQRCQLYYEDTGLGWDISGVQPQHNLFGYGRILAFQSPIPTCFLYGSEQSNICWLANLSQKWLTSEFWGVVLLSSNQHNLFMSGCVLQIKSLPLRIWGTVQVQTHLLNIQEVPGSIPGKFS